MAKQLNVNLAFTADTGKAKAQLQDLQRQLTNIVNQTSKGSNGLGINKDIEDAVKSAAELQVHLNKAINTNTGNLDFSKLSESLHKSGKNLEDYGKQLRDLGPAGQKAFQALATSVANAEIPIRRSNAALTEMWTTLKNTARWQLSSSVLHGFMGAVSTAYGYAQDLNKSLNDIRIVTGQNTDQMADFAEQANKAAKALSTTTTSYTNASLIYYQQGLSEEEVKARTDLTIKMANASGQSAEVVSDQLTAIWNNFSKGADDLEHFADVLTKLGAETASSSEEISIGLEKFAAIGDTIGLSYDNAAAALATVTATTRQSAEVVGTAFKTIFARIQGLNLGETLEDGTSLNKYSEALSKVGISIFDTTGNIKDMNTILDEMGAKWKTISKDQQIALAQTVAGVRQYNQLVALMDNFDFYEQNLSSAQNSAGSLQAQADIYAESWEAAQKRVKAASQAIYQDLLNDEAFIDILNNIEKILTGVDKLIDSVGGLRGVLASIGAIATKAFHKQMAQSLTDAAYSMKMMTASGREEIKNKKLKYIDEASKYTQLKEYSPEDEKARATVLKHQLELQHELIENAERMSEIELETNKKLMDRQKILGDLRIKAAENLEEKKEKSSNTTFNAQVALIRHGRKNYEEYIDENNNLITVEEQIKQTQKEFAILSKQLGTTLDLKTNLPQTLQKMKDNGASSIQMLVKIKDIGKTFDSDSDFSKFAESLRSADVEGDKFNDTLLKMASYLDDSFDYTRALIKDLGLTEEQTQQLVEAIWDRIDAQLELNQITEEEANQQKKLLEDLKNTKGAQKNWADDLVNLANSTMSAVSAIQILGNAFETIQDPDVSDWEKFTTVITAMSTAIPMLTMAFNKQSIASLAAASSAIAHAVGLETTATAAMGAAAATGTFTGSIWTLLWPIGLAVAAIGGLVLIIKHLVEEYNKDADAAKEAVKQTEKLQNQFNEAKNAAEELKSSLNDFDQAVKNIKDLEENTKAYEEAVKAANEQAKELIKINGLIRGQDWEYDNKGLINFIKDENGQTALSRKQNSLEQGVINSENALYGSKIYSNEANLRSQRTDLSRSAGLYNTGELTDTGVYDYRELTNEEVESLVNAFGKIKDAANESPENLKTLLLQSGENLSEFIKNNLDSIISAEKEAFIDLAESTNKAKEANEVYAKTIMQNVLEGQQGQKIASMATNKDGSLNEGLYNLLSGALTEAVSKNSEDLSSQYEKVNVSDIKNNAQLKDYVDSNNLSDYIKDLTGTNTQKALYNDEGLALTYAQMLMARQGKEVNRSSLSYQAGIGRGTVRDAEGNTIVDKVDDEVMRREIAQQAMMDSITAKFESESGEKSDEAMASLQKLTEGANKLGEQYGADFTGALLSSIANGEQERINLSSLFGELSPEEIENLKGFDNAYELLPALGLSLEDIENLGYESATQFVQAFQNGLNDYDPMSYWNEQIAQGQQGQNDAKSALEGLQSGKDLTEEQIAALDRLEEKHKELADTRNLTEHEYLDLVRDIQEEEEKATLEGLEEKKKLLNEKLDDYLVGKIELDDKEFQELMKEIQDTNYSIKLQIDADLATDVDQAFGLAGELANLQEYVGESLKITYDKAQEIIAAGYGAMLQNAKETSDGTIELNKATVNAFIDGKQSELDADRNAKIAQLENQRGMLVAQLETLKAKGEALEGAKKAELGAEKNAALAKAMMLDAEYQAEVKAMQETLESDGQQKTELSENAENLYNTLSGLYETNSENEQNASKAADQASLEHQKNTVNYYNQMQKAVVAYSEAIADAASGDAVYKHVDPIDGGSVGGHDAGQKIAKADFEASEKDLLAEIEKITADLNEDEINAVIDQMIADNKSEMNSVNAQIGAIDAGIAALKSAYKSLDKAQASAGSGKGSKEKDKDAFDIEADKLKKIEEESERYHEVKEALQSVGYELDDISKKKDRAFGANKLKAIEAETKALKKQQKVQKEYVKEIEGYLKQDTEALTKYGANLDADGNISNYDEIVAQQVSTYNEAYLNYITAKNEAVAAYNASAKDESADKVYNDSIKAAESQWKTAETAYNNFKDQVSQYEESLDLLKEQQQALIDIQNQIQDNNYEKLTYKLELEMIINDNEMKELDYYFEKMEGDIEKAVEAFGILQDKLDTTSEKLFDYEDHFNSLEQAYAAGQISQADYIAGLQECYDALYDNIEALNDLDKQMMEYYGETYDIALEKIETYTSQMEHLSSVLDHYKSIMSLLGKESDFETMGVIIEGQVKVAEDSYKSSKSIYELAKGQKEAAYEELMSAENDAERELLQKNYDKALEEFNNAQETMLADAETYGELIKEALVNSMNQAAKEMEKALTGVWGSFENLQEQMGLHSTHQEEFLTNTNKLYETNKLLNQVAQDMEKTDNRASKAKYQAFSKEIEQLQEKDKLSKLELEIAQAKYNMLQAQIALEEAQNAKSMVRLTRDSEGNYGYVYTADKDKVNQAEQDLADAENDLYNIRLNATNDYAEKIVQARADMLDKLKELDERAAEDEEYRLNQYENDKANIQKAYYDLIDDYSRLHTIAQEEDVRVQQDAWTNFYSDVIDQGEDWKNAITDYNNKIILSFEEWEAKSDLLTEAIAEDITDITDASENLKNTLVEDVIPAMADTLDEVRTLTAEYALQRESVLDLADAYGVLAGNIKEAIREEAQKAKNTNNELENVDTTKDSNAQLQETRPADAGPGSSSSGDGILNVGDEVTFTGGVYYHDSEGGGPTGSRGPGKKVRVDRIKPGSNYPIHVISGDSAFGWLREDQLSGFDTGGYTGEWGAEGKLALLHEKEIVLNPVDTENLLASISILRELTKAIDLNATWANMGIGSLNAVGVSDTSTTLEQKVEIRAEFPNATDHNEIEEAFNTLINRASQYANRF